MIEDRWSTRNLDAVTPCETEVKRREILHKMIRSYEWHWKENQVKRVMILVKELSNFKKKKKNLQGDVGEGKTWMREMNYCQFLWFRK